LNNPNIEHLFPFPVYQSKLHRNIIQREKDAVLNLYGSARNNQGNLTSKDNYVLEFEDFKDLKQDIMIYVDDYLKKIISPKEDVSLYITQSWLNYTGENEFHHKHEHSNSIVSGVFYFDADIDLDKIVFFHNRYNQIFIQPDQWNIYNSPSWWFPVETGDIILFPSSLTHMVETKQGDNTRTSLAFNTFVKGTLGSNMELTELKLKG